MFLEPVKKILISNPKMSLSIVPNCGHVVNIEKADIFNEISINFIHKLA
jgi:pimeloyl-ACP methyl ester carboxylesterase